MVVALFEAVAYRDLSEIRDWAEELADDPALVTHSPATAVLGTAPEAAYHRLGSDPPTHQGARTKAASMCSRRTARQSTASRTGVARS
jgi:hypothetical protein